MIVIMARVQVCGDDGLVPPAQHPLGQLQPDLVCQLRRDLALGKALYQMVPLHAVRLVPAHSVCPHILIG